MLKKIHKEVVGCFLNKDITFSLLVLRRILFPSEVFTLLGLEAWKWEFSYLTFLVHYKERNSKLLMCLKQKSKPPYVHSFLNTIIKNILHSLTPPNTHKTANLSPLLQPNLSHVWSLKVCLAAATACQQAVMETVTMATAKWEFLRARKNVLVIIKCLQDRSLVSPLSLFFIAVIILLKHPYNC